MVNETRSQLFQLAVHMSVINEKVFGWSYEIGSTYPLLIGLLIQRVGHRETCWLAGMEDHWGHQGTAFSKAVCLEVSGRVWGLPLSSCGLVGNCRPPPPPPPPPVPVLECLPMCRSASVCSLPDWRLGRPCLSLQVSFHHHQPRALPLMYQLRSWVGLGSGHQGPGMRKEFVGIRVSVKAGGTGRVWALWHWRPSLY